MVNQSFKEAWNSYLAQSPRTTKAVLEEQKVIISFFYQIPGKITAKQILSIIPLQISPSKLNSRLRELVKKSVIIVRGKRITYIRDIKNDKVCFGSDIGEIIDKYLHALFADGENRSAVMDIIVSTLKDMEAEIGSSIPTDLTIDKLLEYLGDDYSIDFYSKSFKKIQTTALILPHTLYGELIWQNMANRYSLPDEISLHGRKPILFGKEKAPSKRHKK